MTERQDDTGRPGLIRALLLSLFLAVAVALLNEVLRRRRSQPPEQDAIEVMQREAALATRTATVTVEPRERRRPADEGSVGEVAPSDAGPGQAPASQADARQAPPSQAAEVQAPPSQAAEVQAPPSDADAEQAGTDAVRGPAGDPARPSPPGRLAVAPPAVDGSPRRLQEPLPPSRPPPEPAAQAGVRPAVIALIIVAVALLAAAVAVLVLTF